MISSKTERGGDVLCYEGYEYIRRVDRLGKNGELTWRCRFHRKYRCLAGLKTLGNKVIIQPPNHSHMGNILKAKASAVQAGLHETSSMPDARTSLGEAVLGVKQEVLKQLLPKRQCLKRDIEIMRRKINKNLPLISSLNFSIPDRYTDMVLFDTGTTDVKRILAVGHPEFLTLLSGEMYLGFDMLYDIPNIPFKLYTIHCKNENLYTPPCIYFLLPDKTKESYTRMIELLKLLVPSANPSTIILTFEIAAIDSFKKEFPSAEVKGCYYYLQQAIIRKVEQLGLWGKFQTDIAFNLIVKSLGALSFVPLDEVLRIFGMLVDTFPDDDQCNQLLTYFESTYIRGPHVGSRVREARFPPLFWNTFYDNNNIFEMNNVVKSFHNSLYCTFRCKQASLWGLLDKLKADIADHRLAVINAAIGLDTLQQSQCAELEKHLLCKMHSYEEEDDKVLYLRTIVNIMPSSEP